MNEIRTITTTNKTTGDFMLNFDKTLAKQMANHQAALMKSILGDEYSLGKRKTIIHRRVDRVTTRKRIVSYPKGYWAKIEINDTDHVTYKVFNSGWLAKTFNKIGFRKVLGNGWDSVKQRDTVEATLGATYMAIDEAIAEDLRQVEHSKFLKEMIKTDPDNLKAIAQLDMLDKGDGPGAEDSSGVSAQAGTISPKTYGQNIKVAGSGAYYTKEDPTKPAAIGVGPLTLAAGGTSSLSINSGEDMIKVEPDGGISFGDKMAEAIHKAAQTEKEKGEVNGT